MSLGVQVIREDLYLSMVFTRLWCCWVLVMYSFYNTDFLLSDVQQFIAANRYTETVLVDDDYFPIKLVTRDTEIIQWHFVFSISLSLTILVFKRCRIPGIILQTYLSKMLKKHQRQQQCLLRMSVTVIMTFS